MRSHPLSRTIIATVALTLLGSSAALAQEELRLPESPYGAELQSAVVTSALDPSSVNAEVLDTARTLHVEMEGRTSGKNNGWRESGPLSDADAVTEAVRELVRNEIPPHVVTVSGGDNQANVATAAAFLNTQIIDLGQTLPCVTTSGQPDSTGECAGGDFAVPRNYTAVEFAVEEGAYLAGVVAAKASFGQGLGVISGYENCTECGRYVAGFVNGARSVEPEIEIEVAYLADNALDGFSDPETARTFAEAFIDVHQPAVLLAVGRAATIGMVEAACDAGIKAVATGTDLRATNPELDCTLASVTTDTSRALRDRLIAFSYLEAAPVATYGLANGGVAVTDEWRDVSLPVDTRPTYEEAERRMLAGEIEACDETCNLGPPVTTIRE